MNNQSLDGVSQQIENTAISALAAASKTPFRTAFKITVGIGLGHLFLFTLFLGVLVAAYKIVS